MSPYGPLYDDIWVLNTVNRHGVTGERSSTVTESGQEENPFGDPSIPPSAFSDISSYFHEQDLELDKILSSDAALNSALLGPDPADIAGLAMVNGYHDPEQYLSTPVDLDIDASIVDAHDAVDNADNHRQTSGPSPEIPFRPLTSGSNGLLAPPPSRTRPTGGRKRNAAMKWNPGPEAEHRTPVVVQERYSLVASTAPSTVNQRVGNEDIQMTEAPVIPIINKPLPDTLFATRNSHNLDSNRHISANNNDDLMSLDTQRVDDHESISEVSSNANGRSRKLKDRAKTKRVRDKGACSACRIQRRECDSDDECERCKEFCTGKQLPFVPCIRKTPSEILGFVSERWASKKTLEWYESLPKGPTGPGSSERVVEIRRSPNLNRAYLRVTCREVTFQSSKPVDCYPVYIPVTDRSPGNETICAWSERDSFLENRTTFEGRIEQCLLSYMGIFHHTYVSNGRLSPLAHTEAVQLYKLMENVRNMTCMIKIWAYEARNMFFTPSGPFSKQLLPVQLHFHLRAGKAISSAERELLKGLDAFLKPPTALPEETSGTRSAFTVALWLSMWQVILMYQEVLGQLSSADVMTKSDERRNFIRLTEDLFESVVVLYSNRFRTWAVVKRLLDAMNDVEVFGNNGAVLSAFKDAWDSRTPFYDEVERHPHPNKRGELLRAHVIAREREVFNRRR